MSDPNYPYYLTVVAPVATVLCLGLFRCRKERHLHPKRKRSQCSHDHHESLFTRIKVWRLVRFTHWLTPHRLGRIHGWRRRRLNFAGVYVLHNCLNGKNYVGQSVHVFDRVCDHFGGEGCGGVYRDYRRGQPFLIQMIPLRFSGFRNLNEMERVLINHYDAFHSGYNKTHGNHN